MNFQKLIPLLSLEFIFFLIIGYLSVNITSNTNIIFTPKIILPQFLFLLLIIIVSSIFNGLIIGLLKDKKLSLILSVIVFSGYFLTTIQLLLNNPTYRILIMIHYILILSGIIISFIEFNKDMNNYVKFKLGRLTANSFKNFFFVLQIAITILFYISNTNLKIKDVITDELISTLIEPTTAIIENQINKQINEQVNTQLQSLNINLANNLSTILPMVNKDLIQSIQNNYAGDIDTTKINIIYSEDTQELQVIGIKNVMNPIIKTTILKYAEPYEKYLTLITTVLFYLTLSWTLYLMQLLIKPLSWLFELFLVKIGFIKKEKEMIEVERITL